MIATPEPPSIVGTDGHILLMSCDQFVRTICNGNACFVCGVDPEEADFNDEHIVPRWILRRFGLFEQKITLPTGERRKYGGYRVQCCSKCNALLGDQVETPISQLLLGTYKEVSRRLKEPRSEELLFTWLSLLFLKIHLKDGKVPVHKDRRRGSNVIGDAYEWSVLHHIHAVARSTYTGAHLLPGVVGSVCLYEIQTGIDRERYDYVNFTNEHTLAVQVGNIGIVAVLTDAGAARVAWLERLACIDGPLSNLQLREVAAMLAVANANLLDRPVFGTFSAEGQRPAIFCQPPSGRLGPYDPEEFGHALLFAVQQYVAERLIEVDGVREPSEVATKICSGRVSLLFDEAGSLRRLSPKE